MENIIYPIGRLTMAAKYSDAEVAVFIDGIESLPSRVNEVLSSLKPENLNQTYRPGGWSLKQIVHHLADSHMNAYIRFKLAATEYNPTIKPYNENQWAALPDASNDNLLPSLAILGGLHIRWAELMRSMSPSGFDRTYYHPENQRTYTLRQVACMYHWHGSHHLGHIRHIISEH